MLIIRLQRAGKKNQPFFRVVLAEKIAPVKGKFLEKLGYFNPVKKEFSVNKERIEYWKSKGAAISDSVYNMLIEKKILGGEKKIVKIKKKKAKKGKEGDEQKTESAKGEEKLTSGKEEGVENKEEEKPEEKDETSKEEKQQKNN